MKNSERTEYVTRDTILKLLSDEEIPGFSHPAKADLRIARVCTAETAEQLVDGDEYVDLGCPEQGVRSALGRDIAAMGRVLPRKAVHEKTWRNIVILLAVHQIEGVHAPLK